MSEYDLIIGHVIPDDAVNAAVTEPGVMIIADGGLRNGKGHPRSTGTFSRVLGRYVRELKALTLMEALAKMTQMPARRLEGFAPMAKKLGRICVGASADLTLFDPARIPRRAASNSIA